MMKIICVIILFIIFGKIVEAKESQPIIPIPEQKKLSSQEVNLVSLGEKLFNDKRLSKNNTISCQSCHNLSLGGSDGKRFSIGSNNEVGAINTPTIVNSSLSFKQFWDGRANSLEDQIQGPIHNPIEMGSDWKEITKKLSKDIQYIKEFQKVFNGPVTGNSIVEAIVAYEQTLTTPGSRFDQYLNGKTKAITKEELEGYEKFKSFGCISCHQGVNVGGNMFQTMGIARDFFKERGQIKKSDLGLYNRTNRSEDMHVFKVPGLRNVSLTAPYFHDGSASTLEEAIYIMGRYQLGIEISKADIRLIKMFLESISGPQPKKTDK